MIAVVFIADQDFEPTLLPFPPDINYKSDYGRLSDPVDIPEYFIVKSRMNPFRSICERHSQLSKQSGGNHRKRIRSRTWWKSKKPDDVYLMGIVQLIFIITLIIKMKRISLKTEMEVHPQFWALLPALNINLNSKEFEFEWLCVGIYISKIEPEIPEI
jgi:hypothetical protein